MNEETRNGTFIPCGDSMEKMSENIRSNIISDESLEQVTGGMGAIPTISNSNLKICPKCGGQMLPVFSAKSGKPVFQYFSCSVCSHRTDS